MILDQDQFVLTSVGMDVGSATTNLVVSDLHFERLDGRYVLHALVERHAADPVLTPYTGEGTIDGGALRRFVEDQYRLAGVTAGDVALGAVILTGLALEQRNAREVGAALAAAGGRFVSFAAGDDQEATLAAFGSGAVRRSTDGAVLNIDIGGGTTKIARCREGRVEEVTALDVGARLLTYHRNEVVTAHWPVPEVAAALGIDARPGRSVDATERRALADRLVRLVIEAAKGGDPVVDGRRVLRRPPLDGSVVPDWLVVSGGVAAYLDEDEERTFGDLGPELAAALAAALGPTGWRRVAPDRAAIRCTVMGVAEQTVQVSGPTVSTSGADELPLQDLQLVRLPLMGAGEEQPVAESVERRLARALAGLAGERMAIGVEWNGPANFDAFDAAAHGIVAALDRADRRHDVAVVVCDEDVGRLLGNHLRGRLGHDRVIVVDGIEIRPFAVVDVGVPVPPAGVVPVSIKSLVVSGAVPAGRAGDRPGDGGEDGPAPERADPAPMVLAAPDNSGGEHR